MSLPMVVAWALVAVTVGAAGEVDVATAGASGNVDVAAVAGGLIWFALSTKGTQHMNLRIWMYVRYKL